jgi:F-type H+-transporting ATPase subunit delta
MTSAVGYRYARALADIVFQPGSQVKPADALAQLKSIEELLHQSSELRGALMTPAISPKKKRAVLNQLSGELGVSPVIRNFLFVVLDHRRIAHLSEMREAFEIAIDEALGVVRAEVVSADKLDDQQSAALQTELTRLSGKQVRLQFSVDPSLLGGVLARLGSTVYDGSIRGQLEQMRRRLTAEAADYKVGI